MLTEYMVKNLSRNRVYLLGEIYALCKDFCEDNEVSDWKHGIRGRLSEKNGIRRVGCLKVFHVGRSKYVFA